MDALIVAAVERLAEQAGDEQLVEYLSHSSHHSVAFMDEVKKHHDRLKDVDAFTASHRALTQPGGESKTYTKAELDAMVADSVRLAVSEANKNKEKNFTRAELDKAIADSVEKALAKQRGGS
jgi:hypothetical protein